VQARALEFFGSQEALDARRQLRNARAMKSKATREKNIERERIAKLNELEAAWRSISPLPLPDHRFVRFYCDPDFAPRIQVVLQKLQRFVEKQQRRETLVAALAARGLPLRSDSKLCDAWIKNQTDLTLEQVVETMWKMKIVYQDCQFEQRWDNYRAMQEFYDHDDYLYEMRKFQDILFKEWQAALPK
jgi:hypothetical protein